MTARMAIGGLMSVLMLGAGCAKTRPHEYAFAIAPTTGAVAVDVENFRGSVEVRTDPRLSQAEVHATSNADFETKAESEAALGETWVDATLEELGARGVLRVRTGTKSEQSENLWIDLSIRLPRCGGVRIDNRGGNVEVVGASGGTQITNRQGAVEFRTNEPMLDPVTITTTDGYLYYQVPTNSTGLFDLQTLDGKAWYRDRVNGTDRAYSAPGTYQARLNEGTNTIELRTNRGDINVWVDEDPVALTRLFKRELPDPQDFFFLQGSRRHTRNLPEDHPELTRVQETVNPYHDGY